MTLAVAAAGISTFALLYAPQPVLPQLAEHFALTPGGASLAISVATGALAVAVLPVAALSEAVGRRPVIVTSLLASVLLGLLLPFAPTFPAFLALRAVQGVAIAGFPGVAAAYLVERLGRGGVAAAVGAMIAGNTLGGMLGRLASGFTAASLDWRGSLLVVAAAVLFFALPGALLLPRVREQGSFTTVRRKQSSLAHVRNLLTGTGYALREPVLLAQYAVAFLAMGSFVALYNAAGFRLTKAPLNLSPAAASLVFLSYAVGSSSSATAGRLAGRFGRSRILVSGLTVTVAGGVSTLCDSLPLVVMGFVVLTGGFFAAHAVANGWAAAEAPATARGQVSGLYTLAYYLGSSLGGAVGSWVYGEFGWPWLIAMTATWLGLAILAVVAVSVTQAPSATGERHKSSFAAAKR